MRHAMRSIPVWAYFYSSAIGLLLAWVYFLAWRKPDRNRLTKFIQRYLSHEYVRGWRPNARLQMLVISVICFSLSLFIVVLFLVREGSR